MTTGLLLHISFYLQYIYLSIYLDLESPSSKKIWLTAIVFFHLSLSFPLFLSLYLSKETKRNADEESHKLFLSQLCRGPDDLFLFIENHSAVTRSRKWRCIGLASPHIRRKGTSLTSQRFDLILTFLFINLFVNGSESGLPTQRNAVAAFPDWAQPSLVIGSVIGTVRRNPPLSRPWASRSTAEVVADEASIADRCSPGAHWSNNRISPAGGGISDLSQFLAPDLGPISDPARRPAPWLRRQDRRWELFLNTPTL